MDIFINEPKRYKQIRTRTTKAREQKRQEKYIKIQIEKDPLMIDGQQNQESKILKRKATLEELILK